MSTETIDWTKSKALKEQLELHEGKRSLPYLCTAGKTTIGIGRNLTDRGLSEDEIELLFQNDVALIQVQLDSALPWWRSLSERRQLVILDMCFNLGITRLMEFHRTLAFIQKGLFTEAAVQMLSSKWAKQVKSRATRLATMMREG
jgi:lysozyme